MTLSRSFLLFSGITLAPLAGAQNAPAPTQAQALTLVRSGNSYLNLSLIGDVAVGAATHSETDAVQAGGHDPSQRGFTVQGVEVVFEGAVDTYFRAMANVVYGLNAHGESFLELEEAYAETLSLPAGLQLRAGQYLTEFGRINTQHLHSWDFVDAPLVTARFLGPDGLRNPGARLSWLAPTPFYSELFVGVQNSAGETAHSFRGAAEEEHDHGHGGMEPFGRPAVETGVHGIGDMLWTARYAFSADLTDTQTVLAGISGAWGPNATGEGARTQLYGLDFYWKWKSASHHKGFPFVTVQAELLFRGYTAAGAEIVHGEPPHAHTHVLPRETLWDWGAYAQASYGFTEGWVASLRADYAAPVERGRYEAALHGAVDEARAIRWRVSPALTWYPSEFSRVRLQYNYDHGNGGRAGFRNSHGVWLQLEFLLGSHGAHQF
ncbi:MAG: hypothetical protein LBD14_05475 [Puniceicoccales bacterium]|jgi:hypothetical protein|nr:hypothetical protein [Puniceicoccales bacterium]